MVVMADHETPVRTRVEPTNSAKIVDGRGTVIRGVEGNVWITQAGDPRYIVLRPGQTFTLDRDGLTLLVAFERPAVVLIGGHDGAEAAETSHSSRSWSRAA